MWTESHIPNKSVDKKTKVMGFQNELRQTKQSKHAYKHAILKSLKPKNLQHYYLHEHSGLLLNYH